MEITLIKTAQLVEVEGQTRSSKDETKLKELSESIKSLGVLEPVIVKKTGEDYTVVAGRRRVLASKMAKLKEVPCIIKELEESTELDVEVQENLQRENLSLADESRIVGRVVKSEKSILKAAARLSKNLDWVTIRNLISKLPKEVLEHADKGLATNSFLSYAAVASKERLEDIVKEIKENPKAKFSGERAVRTKNLSEAIFPLDKKNFIPKTPACISCPHNSSCNQLFAEANSECSNTNCFDAKQAQALSEKAIEIVKEVPDVVLILSNTYSEEEEKVQDEFFKEANKVSGKELKPIEIDYEWDYYRLSLGKEVWMSSRQEYIEVNTIDDLISIKEQEFPDRKIGINFEGLVYLYAEKKSKPKAAKLTKKEMAELPPEDAIQKLRDTITAKEENLAKFVDGRPERELKWMQSNIQELIVPKLVKAKMKVSIEAGEGTSILQKILTKRIEQEHSSYQDSVANKKAMALVRMLTKSSAYHGKEGRTLLASLFKVYAPTEYAEQVKLLKEKVAKRKKNAKELIKSLEITIKETEEELKK